MPGQPLEHHSILSGLVESLGHTLQVVGVNRLEAHENPLAAALGDERYQLFVAQQVHADLRHPGYLRAARDDLPQQRLGPFRIDGEVVVDEEDGDLSLCRFSSDFSRSSSFTTLSFERKRMESPKNPVT